MLSLYYANVTPKNQRFYVEKHFAWRSKLYKNDSKNTEEDLQGKYKL